jgi:S-adenosyl methyltransferase
MAAFGSGDPDNSGLPAEIDTSKPHPARIYDYLLGGKDHFAADRETATVALEAWPTVRTAARENRAFLGRAVRYLAEEAGITQFLDIGSGLPSVGNVHEVAQDVLPSAHAVYVDNDRCKSGCAHTCGAGQDAPKVGTKRPPTSLRGNFAPAKAARVPRNPRPNDRLVTGRRSG